MLGTLFSLYIKAIVLVLDLGWIWMPFFLAVAFFESWMYYIRRRYWRNLKWIILEVKPPKEVDHTPKNMELIFAGLWGSFGTVGNKLEKYIKGFMQDYFSFEIVGFNGEVHFYLRVLEKFRDLVEAQFYSQFPRAEIREVPDYVYSVPATIPDKNWNLWGCLLSLAKSDVYPIRMHGDFMDEGERPYLDPLSSVVEIMGKLKPSEQVWIQMLFRPIKDDWTKRSDKEIDKLMERKVDPKTKDTISSRSLLSLSPSTKEAVEGISKKGDKKGFQTKIQWAYIGRKEIFTMANVSAVMGAFNQYSNLNANSLVPDKKTMTRANYLFAKVRKAYKQRILMRLLRQRSFWEKGYVFNIEELATFYHMPTAMVSAPSVSFVEAIKGGPPGGLPLE